MPSELRFDKIGRFPEREPTETAGRVRVGREEWGTEHWGSGYFRLEPVG
jgi:hypothetical protein